MEPCFYARWLTGSYNVAGIAAGLRYYVKLHIAALELSRVLRPRR